MDILTHTLSGIAIGTVVASFSHKGFLNKLGIVTLAGFAGFLPDFDAISLWSGFDSTIGAFFGLSHSGKEIYSAKFWYSHHAFMHSFFASLLIAILIGLICYAKDVVTRKKKHNNFLQSLKKHKLLLLAFVFGFLIHLFEDMPTPSSTWGGVNFFWPHSSYIGGTGDIWWWNNYDIFLIVCCVLIINTLLTLVKKLIHFNIRIFSVVSLVIGITLATIQIKSRTIDYSYTGHTNRYYEYETSSKQEQKDILGEKIYHLMEKLDNTLPFYF